MARLSTSQPFQFLILPHLLGQALQVVSTAFRYSGGSAIYFSNTMQRCLRDIDTAAQHLMVSNSGYENYGQLILGLPEADPMG